jgi:hypothetical protein
LMLIGESLGFGDIQTKVIQEAYSSVGAIILAQEILSCPPANRQSAAAMVPVTTSVVPRMSATEHPYIGRRRHH